MTGIVSAGSSRVAVEFTGFSPAFHQADTATCEGQPAMQENIVIPINIERVKIWTRRALEAAGWLICLGLLAASAAVAINTSNMKTSPSRAVKRIAPDGIALPWVRTIASLSHPLPEG